MPKEPTLGFYATFVATSWRVRQRQQCQCGQLGIRQLGGKADSMSSLGIVTEL